MDRIIRYVIEIDLCKIKERYHEIRFWDELFRHYDIDDIVVDMWRTSANDDSSGYRDLIIDKVSVVINNNPYILAFSSEYEIEDLCELCDELSYVVYTHMYRMFGERTDDIVICNYVRGLPNYYVCCEESLLYSTS